MTPLYIATKKGNKEIVELLLSRQDIDINLKSVFKIRNDLISFQKKNIIFNFISM